MNENIYITTYKKNLGKNYMVIDTPNHTPADNKHFRTRMIHENQISGLLNTYVQYIDDIPSFQYDITGLQSLEVMLDTTPITHTMLCKLFSGIYNALISLENYLLIHDHIILSPEYIYISGDYSEVYLCYYPLKNRCFVDSLRSFFDYILKKVDHKDEKCVCLAYSMHRYCNDNNFNLNTLYDKLSSTQITSPSNITDSTLTSNNNINLCKRETHLSSKLNEYKNDNFELKQIHKDSNLHASQHNIKNIFDSRVIFLLAFIITGISLSTILYILELYPISFYLTLLITIIMISVYNGYHIYKQSNGNVCIAAPPIQEPCYNPGTVLLSGSPDENTHKLIYTGTGDGSDISVTHFPFVIGKTDACSAKVQSSVISRLHAKLTLLPTDNNGEDIFLEDLNSTNGTLLNNVPLTPYEKYPITSGDYITFGHLTYIFR